MGKKVRSVRVPEVLSELDLTSLVKECEQYLRDIESATLLKSRGNKDAAEALIAARQEDLGKKVSHLVWEARVQWGAARVKSSEKQDKQGKVEKQDIEE
ncbi:MAG: hypothetical protein D6E12_04730 [Desulfovibrio sp.]|nr:MAG: hypothetical protein D6E12_04730 [Desulfovibrio sp.]